MRTTTGRRLPSSPGRSRADYGNGDVRRAALDNHCDEVQAEVNCILVDGSASQGSFSSDAGADVESLARAVIRGGYVGGDACRATLG